MKLTKQQARLHAQAESLLGRDVLSRDDKLFILEHWREDANHVNSTAGAFFTPWQLALDRSVTDSGMPFGLAQMMSTAVAARATGRRAVCFEIRESQCEAAAARLDQGVLDFGGEA